MNVSEYKILWANDGDVLANKVTDHLRQGWSVTGGLVLSGSLWFQAVYKIEYRYGGGEMSVEETAAALKQIAEKSLR